MMDENHTRAEPWDAGRVLREALIVSALDSAARVGERLTVEDGSLRIREKRVVLTDLDRYYENLTFLL